MHRCTVSLLSVKQWRNPLLCDCSLPLEPFPNPSHVKDSDFTNHFDYLGDVSHLANSNVFAYSLSTDTRTRLPYDGSVGVHVALTTK